jgi:hypothetical protein
MVFAGSALVLATLVDVFCSLVRTPLRAGPFTTMGERLVCRNLYRAFRLTGARNLLAAIGPASVAIRALMVLVALMAGWSLIVFAEADWVVDADTGAPADVWQRLYYVGYTISTLGLGDVLPNAVPARIATVGASLTGFTVITFVVGSISPLSDVIAARNTVASIMRAHRTAVMAGADVRDTLDKTLDAVLAPLIAVSSAVETLPVRHRMHAEREHLALSTALAELDLAIADTDMGTDIRAVAIGDAIDTILDVLSKDWLKVQRTNRSGRLRAYVEADRLSWPDHYDG